MVSDLFELSKATLNGLLVSGLHALAQYVECSESIDHGKTCQGTAKTIWRRFIRRVGIVAQ